LSLNPGPVYLLGHIRQVKIRGEGARERNRGGQIDVVEKLGRGRKVSSGESSNLFDKSE
jgi:hypothetical protein